MRLLGQGIQLTRERRLAIRLPRGLEIHFWVYQPEHALDVDMAVLGPHKKWGMHLGFSFGLPTWWRWRLVNERRRSEGKVIHDLEAGWLMLNLGFAFAHLEVQA